jgi:hypothetical protein
MERSYKNSEDVITGKTVYLECGGFAFLRYKTAILKGVIHALESY